MCDNGCGIIDWKLISDKTRVQGNGTTAVRTRRGLVVFLARRHWCLGFILQSMLYFIRYGDEQSYDNLSHYLIIVGKFEVESTIETYPKQKSI